MCDLTNLLSCVNGTLLNPFTLNAQDPKFELELVIDWSPPLGQRNDQRNQQRKQKLPE